MNFEQLMYICNLVGVSFFAASGVLMGLRQKMDIFGMLVLAIVTALGGGILRSVLIGDVPLAFLKDPNYLMVCIGTTIFVYLSRKQFLKKDSLFKVLDAIGLGLFVSTGISLSLHFGLPMWASILLGVISAAFGGVIRDVLCAQVPLIFRKELYASICVLGGVVYAIFHSVSIPEHITVPIVALLTTALRLLAIRYNLKLPR